MNVGSNERGAVPYGWPFTESISAPGGFTEWRFPHDGPAN